MKIQLIDARPGVVKSVVLKEWMRIALSICLLGLPVILGYFSIQIVEARNTEIAKNSLAPALGSTGHCGTPGKPAPADLRPAAARSADRPDCRLAGRRQRHCATRTVAMGVAAPLLRRLARHVHRAPLSRPDLDDRNAALVVAAGAGSSSRPIVSAQAQESRYSDETWGVLSR